MTLSAAGAPVPAMKYELLPEVRDLRTGNAAVNYHRSRSPEWEHSLARHPDLNKFQEWLDLPLAQAPLDRIGSGVIPLMLKELDIAARTEHCDFQMLQRLREEGPAMLVPDMQGFRTMAVLLALRSRAEMREGKLDRAAYTFQTALAMSQHIGETPTLITYLVGVAAANVTMQRIEEFVQQPGAPNLYWSLTDLPHPLIDARRPLQGERIFVENLFPEIRRALHDPKAAPIPAQTLRANLDKLPLFGIGPNAAGLAISAAASYPRARQYLLDRGWSADAVAAMPVTQVTLMHGMAQHEKWFDEFYKLHNLPYSEAHPRLVELDKRLTADLRNHVIGTPFRELMYDPSRIYRIRARLERQIALLRCVEAIRLHAAAHDGALPATLAAIAVPVPVDPITGKAFQYAVAGRTATVDAVAPAGEPTSEYTAVRIEITIAPPKQ